MVKRATFLDHLVQSDRHIALGKEHIANQRKLLAEI
jgi:hypothetical protein